MVPYRNAYEPRNGQRGYGTVVKIDLNYFGDHPININSATNSSSSSSFIELVDLPSETRVEQIPSYADTDLRGFSGGFASGKFIFMVPFFSGIFSGKLARLQFFTTIETGGSTILPPRLQELDLTHDRGLHGTTYKGYRAGFPSLWQATFP